jgi:ATP/maltotriose-dependent transcriptional regulator MalT
VSEFPVQAAKVQRPALRTETLQRDRLLDWLSAQADSRVILVTAEAGYGKTTLLADFSRRTRRRVLWYRIDENDRSWVSLVRYLVAAGQEVDPDFGAATRALVDRLGTPDGPSRDEVVATLIRDFSILGTGGGTILILDDYHQIDDVAEIRAVLNEFVAHAPERLTIVIAGRRAPSLTLGRLRSIGAVVELRTEDLRFDLDESERLFRDIYARTLDQALLADLTRRTDGWAACLQLVQAALRNRSGVEIRDFVEGLTGATGDLHDYLAEEVVGDLQPATQRFLMRAALLQSVFPKLAAVVGEIDDIEAGRQVAKAEHLGLLSRRSNTHAGGRRYHPLVQEFLEARLRREVGDEEIVRLHRLIAQHAAASDWRLAAHHFAAAGDIDDLHRLVEASVPSIMAGGDFAIAESFIDRLPDGRTWPIFDIVLSRMELHRGRPDDAVHLAESAVAALRSNEASPILDQALANLTSVYYQAGRLRESRETASILGNGPGSGPLVTIATAVVQLIDSSVDGRLTPSLNHLYEMAANQRLSGDLHYFGITQLNIGESERAKGNAVEALTAANEAISALNASSASHEMPAARLIRAWSLAHQNHDEAALRELDLALGSEFRLVRDEVRVEAASTLLAYLDRQRAREVLAGLGPTDGMTPDLRDQYAVVLGELDLADGFPNRTLDRLESVDVETPHRESGFKARVMALRALSAVLAGDADAPFLAGAAHDQALRQGVGRWGIQAEILVSAVAGDQALETMLRSRGDAVGPWVSVLAELFLGDWGGNSPYIQSVVEDQVMARPERWRPALRRTLIDGSQASRDRAAALLDKVGEPSDVQPLRDFSRKSRGARGTAVIGRGLARRVADRVQVADLGRVRVQVGHRSVEGDTIRRKVLALLCFLVARPNMAAARDQVVDALWPDQDPAAASNSLNQTVYFLRRVFEPTYVDDLSPGYLRHETDLIWLDPGLVSAESEICRLAIEEARRSSVWASVELVSRSYRGRFALDFEYEEWSTSYRDNLVNSHVITHPRRRRRARARPAQFVLATRAATRPFNLRAIHYRRCSTIPVDPVGESHRATRRGTNGAQGFHHLGPGGWARRLCWPGDRPDAAGDWTGHPAPNSATSDAAEPPAGSVGQRRAKPGPERSADWSLPAGSRRHDRHHLRQRRLPRGDGGQGGFRQELQGSGPLPR